VEKRTFGEALKWVRQTRKMTQLQMVEATGISERFYQSLERGEKEPSLGTLEKTLGGLNISYSEFFMVPDPPPRPDAHLMKILIESPESEIPFRAVRAVTAEFLRMEPEVRAAVLAVLYGDKSIAAPYVRKAGRAPGSR
jgi:HTH-type transcriptional repressor of puuD